MHQLTILSWLLLTRRANYDHVSESNSPVFCAKFAQVSELIVKFLLFSVNTTIQCPVPSDWKKKLWPKYSNLITIKCAALYSFLFLDSNEIFSLKLNKFHISYCRSLARETPKSLFVHLSKCVRAATNSDGCLVTLVFPLFCLHLLINLSSVCVRWTTTVSRVLGFITELSSTLVQGHYTPNEVNETTHVLNSSWTWFTVQ